MLKFDLICFSFYKIATSLVVVQKISTKPGKRGILPEEATKL